MKYPRFMVFHDISFYPQGGLEDVVSSFDSAEEAIEFVKDGNWDLGCTIFDRIEGEVLAE